MTAPVRTRRHVPWLLGLAGLVIAVDQLTKTWAINHVSDRSRHVFWTLRLAVTYNSGAAFSIGRGVAPFFVAAAGVMVVVLFLFARRDQSLPTTVALGLVLGGAIGNLSDRIFRHHAGSVIDFVDFRWWPVFNVADACIVTGAILLALSARTHRSGIS